MILVLRDRAALCALSMMALVMGASRTGTAQATAQPLPRVTFAMNGGPTLGASTPFAFSNRCPERKPLGSAGGSIAVRFTRRLLVEVAGAAHFGHEVRVLCDWSPPVPRPVGADTSAFEFPSTQPGSDFTSLGLRIGVAPVDVRFASAQLFAGLAYISERERGVPVTGASMSVGGRVRLRAEVEQWFLPVSRTVRETFYIDGRVTGERDRVQRVTARPTFLRFGFQFGR